MSLRQCDHCECNASILASYTETVMASNRLDFITNHLLPSPCIMTQDTSAGSISAAAKAVLDTRRSIPVLDSYMSYLDTGRGDNVVLFLHGNPTAAYLWRNIIPNVSPIARCVAPDLIGMGHSGKPDIMYKYAEHYKYLSTWIEKMDFPGKITIVCHDWGSGLGFHWCNQNRDRVRAIVHMESLASPMPNWDAFPEGGRKMFQLFRTDVGEELVLKKNMFVERMLPGSIMRTLSDEEMNEYLAPYKNNEKSRLPTLTWPREIPIVSVGPEDVVKISLDYSKWLSTSATIPKLYIDAEPGFFSSDIRVATRNWPNQKTVTVKGLHFVQEDSPDEIGQAIRTFLENEYQKK